MRDSGRWMVAAFVAAGLGLSACTGPPEAADAAQPKPAKVERANATDPGRVTLTADAARRLDIQTAPVRETQVAQQQRKTIPYAAVLYDANGQAWAFTSPEPLTFVRQRITVDHVTGDQAILTDGPPTGTAVVTVGAAELYGAELGLGQ